MSPVCCVVSFDVVCTVKYLEVCIRPAIFSAVWVMGVNGAVSCRTFVRWQLITTMIKSMAWVLSRTGVNARII